MEKKLISYLLPVYNEEDNINLVYTTLKTLIKSLNHKYEFEILFINDGSSDGSLEEMIKLSEKDKNVVVINFSRNFGQQIAITAGLDQVRGAAVIIMDADLQDPPEVSLKLLEKWEEGYEVVYAQRRKRDDSFFKNLTAHLFYRMLDKLTEINIPLDTGDFRLIDKKVVQTIRQFREHNRFMRGLFTYVGFKQTAVFFDRKKRNAGITKYSLSKMVSLALDGITSFSTLPLKIITQLGFFVSLLSFLGILYALIMRLFFPDVTVSGWTFMVISVLFIGGIQLITLGILGTYIGKIYREVQSRPLYIISEIYNNNAS